MRIFKRNRKSHTQNTDQRRTGLLRPFLSVVLSVILSLSLFGTLAFAEEAPSASAVVGEPSSSEQQPLPGEVSDAPEEGTLQAPGSEAETVKGPDDELAEGLIEEQIEVGGESEGDSLEPFLASTPSLDGVYGIQTILGSQKAVEIAGGKLENGILVQTYTENKTPAQRFQIESDKAGYYVIRNLKSGKVLDVKNAAAFSGASVWQYEYNGTDAQKWIIVADADSYQIIPKLDQTLNLDISNAADSNYALLQLYSSNGTNAQKFKLNKLTPALADGLYEIGTKSSDKVLDVSGGSTQDGANVQVYQANNTLAQKFQVVYDSATGYYTLYNAASQKPLDVDGAGASNWTNVQIYSPNNTYAQKWAIAKSGADSYVLYSACSGLTLDVVGAGTANGTNVHTYEFNDTNAQKWTFATTALLPGGSYHLYNANGKVLDVAGGSRTVGSNVQIYSFNGTLAQWFYVTPVDAEYFKIECENSGLLVAAAPGGGTNVELDSDVVTNKKLWKPILSGDGFFYLQNKETGMMLDIQSGSSANGTNVQVAAGNSSGAQKWKFTAASEFPENTYTIKSALNPGWVLDMTDGLKDNGVKPQLYQSNDTLAQKYSIIRLPNGNYRLVCILSNKSLDVSGQSVDANGAGIIHQYTSSYPNPAQEWRFEYAGKGLFTLFSVCGQGTSCLTVNGGAVNGAPVVLARSAGSQSQKFSFEPVATTTYINYSITLDQMAGYQKPYLPSTDLAQIKAVLDPSQSTGAYRYQFADLRVPSGLSTAQLDAFISSTPSGTNGIFKGRGAVFVQAAQQYGLNECYLLAHAIHETGWGTSTLAKGYYYDGKTAIGGKTYPVGTYYNFYGIGAYDSSPLSGGRAAAITNGWDSPEKAILGGAEWIAKRYVYVLPHSQQTLYDMKWDSLASNASKSRSGYQYATDIEWARKISAIMSNCFSSTGQTPTAAFRVPVYA